MPPSVLLSLSLGSSEKEEISTADSLIGVICSDAFSRGDVKGYGLVITRDSITGVKKQESTENVEFHVARETAGEQTLRKDVARAAEGLLAKKEFEIQIASIGQVLFKRPELLSGGYVIIKTANRSIRVDISVLYANPNLDETTNVLAGTLSEAVGWRLCDGRTGSSLVMDRIGRG
jgi:hypothetical protein